MSEELYRAEHGLDFERMQEAEGGDEDDGPRPELLKEDNRTTTDGAAYE